MQNPRGTGKPLDMSRASAAAFPPTSSIGAAWSPSDVRVSSSSTSGTACVTPMPPDCAEWAELQLHYLFPTAILRPMAVRPRAWDGSLVLSARDQRFIALRALNESTMAATQDLA